MGSSKKQTTGWRYLLGLHMGICRGPIDELMEIRVGDRTAWKTRTRYDPIPGIFNNTPIGWIPVDDESVTVTGNLAMEIHAPMLFGGDPKEGGIDGTLDVMMGGPDQVAPERLSNMLGGLVPGFRGMCSLFFNGLVAANNPYPKPWAVRVRRSLTGWDGPVWYAGKSAIWIGAGAGLSAIKAMNPAHILYELYTNRDWGRGMPSARLDLTSFAAAADKLYAEGFGLCLTWSRQGSIAEFQQVILDHIGAACGTDSNGNISLKLIRDDYAIETLPLFDYETGLLGIDEEQISTPATATNEVIVNWHDPIKDEDRQTAPVQNLGAIQAAGVRNSATRDYPGLPTAALAARIALRDLRACSSSLKRYKVRLDRRGYKIQPGDVFRVSDPSRGLANIVLRVGRVDDGGHTSGVITVTAVVDVFGLPSSVFISEMPSSWTMPSVIPSVPPHRRLMEVPYSELAGNMDRPSFALVDPLAGYVAAMAARPSGLSVDFTMLTRTGVAPYTPRGNGSWAPTALTSGAANHATTALVLTAGIDLDFVESNTLALWEDELVRVVSITPTTGALLLARGCGDTVPATHAAGTRIWFFDSLVAVDPTEWMAGETVDVKLLTNTSSMVLDPAMAPADSITLAQRQYRPYPPGRLRINTVAYPEYITGLLSVGWSHRDRVLQNDQAVDTEQGSIGPEPGTTYELKIYGETDLLLRTVEQPGTTYTFTDEAAVSGLWIDDGAAVIAAAEDGEGSLTGWACANTITGGVRPMVLLYDGTRHVAQKQSYSGDPIVVTHSGMLVSTAYNTWSAITTTSTPGGASLGAIHWMEYGSGTYIGNCEGVAGFIKSTDLAAFSQVAYPANMTTVTSGNVPIRAQWDGSQFVLMGGSASGSPSIWTSPTGSTWTVGAAIPVPTSGVTVIASGVYYLGLHGGIHYALYEWDSGAKSALFSSPDLSVWTERFNTEAFLISGGYTEIITLSRLMAYNGTAWVLSGTSNINGTAVLRSTDGAAWTVVSSGSGGGSFPAGMSMASLRAVGGTFMAVAAISGDARSVESTDGITWTAIVTLAAIPAGKLLVVDYADAATVGMFAGVVTSRLAYQSNDGGDSWITAYPQPPSISIHSGGAFAGSGSVEMADPAALGGVCFLPVSGGFDFAASRVIIDVALYTISGTDAPEVMALDERAGGSVVGWGVRLDRASNIIRLRRYVDGAGSNALSISQALAVGTWYRVRAEVIRSVIANVQVYSAGGTLLTEVTNQALTALPSSTRLGSGTASLTGVGRYDEMTWTIQPQMLRLNSRLRIALGAKRDTLISLHQHDVEVLRSL